jgi:iron complex transport system substrate-binding protein
MSGLFTREQAQTAARAWTGAAISLVDVRRFVLGDAGEDAIEDYHLPAPAFLFTSGGKAEVNLGAIPYFVERFGAFHAGRGTVLSVTPHSDWLEAYLLLYKANVPEADSANAAGCATDASTAATEQPAFTQSFGTVPHNPLLFADYLRSMYADYKSATPLGLLHAKGAFYQLVWEIYRDLEQGVGLVLHPDAIALAKRYLDEGFDHQLLIQDICGNLGISAQYLRATFKKRYGCSPQDYLVGLRIDAAKKHLMDSELSLKQIATRLGFYDKYHLSKAFKRIEGITPQTFRSTVLANRPDYSRDLSIFSPYNFPYNGVQKVSLIEHQEKGYLMLRLRKVLVATLLAMLTVGMFGCGTPAGQEDGTSAQNGTAGQSAAGEGQAQWEPVTIKHALGTTVIENKPERVATVNWANHEVPLALGVVPVGMAAANFGDDDEDGLLPWVKERLVELGAETPVLFDETDGIDFEAVADTKPDVILAAYSGLTQEDYDTLSRIAPVVAYPETAWGTAWRDMILYNSKGMGMEAEGEALIASLEEEMAAAVQKHPNLEGKAMMFLTHVDTTDLSEVSFYTTHDTRVMFFEDLGLKQAKSIADASAATDKFALTQSAEQADVFNDVDVIVTYGGEELLSALEGDPVLSQIPAVKNGSIVCLPGTSPLGTAANPTPLAISWVLDDYLDLLDDAASKAK